MSAKYTESMVLSREKRQNAGARMAELLNKEDCDEFYQATYGGFFDEEGDDAYESPESESDYVDSDFDIDESEQQPVEGDNDEQHQDESERPKKSTKAYKEPTYRQKPASSAAAINESRPVGEQDRVSGYQKKERKAYIPPPEKKFRHSTVLKSEEYERRREAYQEKRKRRKKHHRAADYEEKPTQAELLREAKETEELNLKSLERFQQYELEKRKRHRLNKQRLIKGPYVRYLSLTMPVSLQSAGNSSASLTRSDSGLTNSTSGIPSSNLPDRDRGRPLNKFYLSDEQSNGSVSNSGRSTPSVATESNPQADVHALISGGQRSSKAAAAERNIGKCARTFIAFSDDATFDLLVPNIRKDSKLTIPRTQYCVVTGLPAKYLDPLTQLPYANAEAFKIIRDAYYKHVEQKGDKNDPAVAAWLQSRHASTA